VAESIDERIAHVAQSQYGVFSLAQTADVGFNRAQRDARIRTGRWETAYPGVYRMAGAPASWHGELLAACWGAHGLAMASHRSAALLWDLPGGRADLVEITCRRWKRAKARGLVVHEMKLLEEAEARSVAGIPTASIEQTLLGLAAVVPRSVAEMAVDRALHRKLTTTVALRRYLQRRGKRGRNGAGVLRALVAEHDPGGGIPESAMETKLKQLLRRCGLPMPRFQYEIWHDGRFVARVDAAYPEHRIAIEYDSYEHHTGKLAIDRDSDRRARLSRIRWETITFTAVALRSGGGAQLETLRTRLGFGAPRA
jgi:hypothetical protein